MRSSFGASAAEDGPEGPATRMLEEGLDFHSPRDAIVAPVDMPASQLTLRSGLCSLPAEGTGLLSPLVADWSKGVADLSLFPLSSMRTTKELGYDVWDRKSEGVVHEDNARRQPHQRDQQTESGNFFLRDIDVEPPFQEPELRPEGQVLRRQPQASIQEQNLLQPGQQEIEAVSANVELHPSAISDGPPGGERFQEVGGSVKREPCPPANITAIEAHEQGSAATREAGGSLKSADSKTALDICAAGPPGPLSMRTDDVTVSPYRETMIEVLASEGSAKRKMPAAVDSRPASPVSAVVPPANLLKWDVTTGVGAQEYSQVSADSAPSGAAKHETEKWFVARAALANKTLSVSTLVAAASEHVETTSAYIKGPPAGTSNTQKWPDQYLECTAFQRENMTVSKQVLAAVRSYGNKGRGGTTGGAPTWGCSKEDRHRLLSKTVADSLTSPASTCSSTSSPRCEATAMSLTHAARIITLPEVDVSNTSTAAPTRAGSGNFPANKILATAERSALFLSPSPVAAFPEQLLSEHATSLGILSPATVESRELRKLLTTTPVLAESHVSIFPRLPLSLPSAPIGAGCLEHGAKESIHAADEKNESATLSVRRTEISSGGRGGGNVRGLEKFLNCSIRESRRSGSLQEENVPDQTAALLSNAARSTTAMSSKRSRMSSGGLSLTCQFSPSFADEEEETWKDAAAALLGASSSLKSIYYSRGVPPQSSVSTVKLPITDGGADSYYRSFSIPKSEGPAAILENAVYDHSGLVKYLLLPERQRQANEDENKTSAGLENSTSSPAAFPPLALSEQSAELLRLAQEQQGERREAAWKAAHEQISEQPSFSQSEAGTPHVILERLLPRKFNCAPHQGADEGNPLQKNASLVPNNCVFRVEGVESASIFPAMVSSRDTHTKQFDEASRAIDAFALQKQLGVPYTPKGENPSLHRAAKRMSVCGQTDLHSVQPAHVLNRSSPRKTNENPTKNAASRFPASVPTLRTSVTPAEAYDIKPGSSTEAGKRLSSSEGRDRAGVHERVLSDPAAQPHSPKDVVVNVSFPTSGTSVPTFERNSPRTPSFEQTVGTAPVCTGCTVHAGGLCKCNLLPWKSYANQPRSIHRSAASPALVGTVRGNQQSFEGEACHSPDGSHNLCGYALYTFAAKRSSSSPLETTGKKNDTASSCESLDSRDPRTLQPQSSVAKRKPTATRRCNSRTPQWSEAEDALLHKFFEVFHLKWSAISTELTARFGVVRTGLPASAAARRQSEAAAFIAASCLPAKGFCVGGAAPSRIEYLRIHLILLRCDPFAVTVLNMSLVTAAGARSQAIPTLSPERKQCRERWCNHVNPAVKKGGWTPFEDAFILQRQNQMGNRWAAIAKELPGRTENAVKNRFISLRNCRGSGRSGGFGRSSRAAGSDKEDRQNQVTNTSGEGTRARGRKPASAPEPQGTRPNNTGANSEDGAVCNRGGRWFEPEVAPFSFSSLSSTKDVPPASEVLNNRLQEECQREGASAAGTATSSSLLLPVDAYGEDKEESVPEAAPADKGRRCSKTLSEQGERGTPLMHREHLPHLPCALQDILSGRTTFAGGDGKCESVPRRRTSKDPTENFLAAGIFPSCVETPPREANAAREDGEADSAGPCAAPRGVNKQEQPIINEETASYAAGDGPDLVARKRQRQTTEIPYMHSLPESDWPLSEKEGTAQQGMGLQQGKQKRTTTCMPANISSPQASMKWRDSMNSPMKTEETEDTQSPYTSQDSLKATNQVPPITLRECSDCPGSCSCTAGAPAALLNGDVRSEGADSMPGGTAPAVGTAKGRCADLVQEPIIQQVANRLQPLMQKERRTGRQEQQYTAGDTFCLASRLQRNGEGAGGTGKTETLDAPGVPSMLWDVLLAKPAGTRSHGGCVLENMSLQQQKEPPREELTVVNISDEPFVYREESRQEHTGASADASVSQRLQQVSTCSNSNLHRLDQEVNVELMKAQQPKQHIPPQQTDPQQPSVSPRSSENRRGDAWGPGTYHMEAQQDKRFLPTAFSPRCSKRRRDSEAQKTTAYAVCTRQHEHSQQERESANQHQLQHFAPGMKHLLGPLLENLKGYTWGQSHGQEDAKANVQSVVEGNGSPMHYEECQERNPSVTKHRYDCDGVQKEQQCFGGMPKGKSGSKQGICTDELGHNGATQNIWGNTGQRHDCVQQSDVFPCPPPSATTYYTLPGNAEDKPAEQQLLWPLEQEQKQISFLPRFPLEDMTVHDALQLNFAANTSFKGLQTCALRGLISPSLQTAEQGNLLQCGVTKFVPDNGRRPDPLTTASNLSESEHAENSKTIRFFDGAEAPQSSPLNRTSVAEQSWTGSSNLMETVCSGRLAGCGAVATSNRVGSEKGDNINTSHLSIIGENCLHPLSQPLQNDVRPRVSHQHFESPGLPQQLLMPLLEEQHPPETTFHVQAPVGNQLLSSQDCMCPEYDNSQGGSGTACSEDANVSATYEETESESTAVRVPEAADVRTSVLPHGTAAEIAALHFGATGAGSDGTLALSTLTDAGTLQKRFVPFQHNGGAAESRLSQHGQQEQHYWPLSSAVERYKSWNAACPISFCPPPENGQICTGEGQVMERLSNVSSQATSFLRGVSGQRIDDTTLAMANQATATSRNEKGVMTADSSAITGEPKVTA